MTEMIPLETIRAAQERLEKLVHKTPLESNHTFSQISGREVYLKLENLQRTGVFQGTGRFQLYHDPEPGTESQGNHCCFRQSNHAQGVALGSRMAHCRSTVVMPEGAPLAKAEATKGYGAEVVLFGKTFDESLKKAQEIQKETGAYFVHPYDDPAVIAYQGNHRPGNPGTESLHREHRSTRRRWRPSDRHCSRGEAGEPQGEGVRGADGAGSGHVPVQERGAGG